MVQGTDISATLNYIHATSSSAYQNTIPLSTATNIADVGTAVMNAPSAIRNEFASNLYNKIGLTLIDSPVVQNEFSFLKKGTLEHGQMIEDIYVGLAQSQPYVTGMKEGDPVPDPFSIKKLPHYTSFYSTILSRQYQVTKHHSDLKKAFHSASGVAQYTGSMMNSMVSKENYDDMRASIGLLARQVEEGMKEAAKPAGKFKGVIHLLTDFNALYGKTLTASNAFTDQDFIKYFANQLKKYSKRMKHLRTDFNIAGVEQNLPQGKQRLMILEDITVDFETEILAWAYHADKFDLGGVDEIDSWYSIGADHKNPPTVTPEDIKVKSQFTTATGGSTMCVALIYDLDMVKIYNKERIASDAGNAKGNYWNHFMSVEDILACSPYKNFTAFMLD